MTSRNFAESILGEATNKAVQSLSAQLDQRVASVPVKKLIVEGLVADSTDGILVLNIGTKAGVKVGDRLEVRRVTREIKDPATGKVIRRIEDKVGEVAVTDVDETSSIGQFTGASPAKVGDAVGSAP